MEFEPNLVMQTWPEPNEKKKGIMAGEYPGRTPVWNGPMSITTPPPSPAAIVRGLLIEYLIPYPFHVYDADPWPSIRVKIDGTEFEIQKPLPSLPGTIPASSSLCAQGTDICCTVLRVTSQKPLDLKANQTEAVIFSSILPCLRWIRIIGRQYWFLENPRGMGASYRGSTFYGSKTTVSQANFAGYERAVIVRPLTLENWHAIRRQTESGSTPPVQESFFCDAMTSFSAGDVVKALIDLGVAVEIELTDLMDEAVPATKDKAIIADYEQQKVKHRDSFKWKLLELSKICGMADPSTFTVPDSISNWSETALRLYEFRGAAAHRGDTTLIGKHFSSPASLQATDIQKFIFSVETLFHWSETERQRLKLSSFPYRLVPFSRKPILSIIGDSQDSGGMKGFFGRTGEVTANIK
jgi:hypothetical protein